MTRKCWEVCPVCGRSVRIPVNGGTCDGCGARVLPCSACTEAECDRCPYEKVRA